MSNRRAGRLVPKPRYEMPSAQLKLERVSDASWWYDRVWILTNVAAGMDHATVNWARGISDEEWVSPKWQHLVDLGRRFIDALRENPRFKCMSDSSVKSHGSHLLYLMVWMFRNGYLDFSCLTESEIGYFIDDLVTEKIDDDDLESQTISGGTLSHYLEIILKLYLYAPLFESVPGLVIPNHPFGGRSAIAVATSHVALVQRRIPPIPLEIFNPAMTVALSWLDNYPVPIVALQHACLQGRNDIGATVNTKNQVWYVNRRIREVLPTYRDVLKSALRRDSAHAFFFDSGVGLTPILRDIIDDATAAFTFILLAEIGFRLSELCSLLAYPYQNNGWPQCILLRPSATGMFENFFVRGFLYKGHNKSEPQEVEWLAGSRPTGTSWLPDPIRAILALEEIHRPWREMANSSALIVSLSSGGGMPNQLPRESRVLSKTLVIAHNRFLKEHVSIATSFETWRVSGHQLRKRFAESVIEIDNDLVPEVQRHLKQVTRAITEEAYIGNDPYLKRLLDDQTALSTGRLMHELLYGQQQTAGKIVDELSIHFPKMKIWCDQFPDTESKIDALTAIFRQDGIRLWGSPYGDCIFRSEKSRCHHVENHGFDYKATRPLETHRCPDTCAACSNLAISKRHAGYWRNRFEQNLAIYLANKSAASMIVATIARERAKVSRQILIKLGEDIMQIPEE